ncbi:hypothetical protein MTYM_01048 [Methylococcales bacterium]|nr:hypothetical protein MTYM_01048 [Methylococcales bacterium]
MPAIRIQIMIHAGLGHQTIRYVVNIESMPFMKLLRRPQTSFWLPTSTDRFYPDFVAELHDGRIFVIEYKGAHLADTADTHEKRNIGQLWAEKNGGKGVFLMAEKKNAEGQDLMQQFTTALK